MHPHLIGPIKSFGFLLALSFIFGIILSIRRGRSRGLDQDTVMDASFTVLISSLIGVRLFFILTHLDTFDPWWEMFMIWRGGLTLYGGILAAIVAVFWFCRRRGIEFLALADVLAPQVVLGIGLTRIGCFLNGCCFGFPTDAAWGVQFPATCQAGSVYAATAIHPTQLYSSAGGFAVWGLLLLWERFDSRQGGTFGRFLIFYGIARTVADLFRWYETGAVHALGLTTSQLISAAMLLVGLAVLVRSRRVDHGI